VERIGVPNRVPLQELEDEVDMSNLRGKFVCNLALPAVLAAVNAFASPVDSRLLRLVPSGAEIVAGIANPGSPATSGRLLLV